MTDGSRDERTEASSCELKLRGRMRQFRATVDEVCRLESNCPEEERERAESALCLRSRSAYFDFFTWVTIHDEIDPWAKKELADLLPRAAKAMRIARYRDSVARRWKDFKAVCDRVSGEHSLDLVSSVAP